MDDSTVLTDRQGVEEFTYLLLCRRLCFSFAHSRMMLLRYRGYAATDRIEVRY
jgi:hypothetical protein